MMPWLQGYYDTMDSGYRDEHGNIAVMARTDDVINVAGHRLSTGQLEEVRFYFKNYLYFNFHEKHKEILV